MRVTDEMVETIAKWLHDEVEWPEYNYPERSWPEHEGDTGQRGDGWLKIVPPDVCEQFRDIARRLPIEAALAVEGTEAVAWEALEEIRCLKAIIASCQWYWPEDDTSSEVCADSGREALVERAYLDPGYVTAYARGGIVERRFFGWLPPADDADSDDEFEVDEATRAEAVAKMEAEKARRAALRGQS